MKAIIIDDEPMPAKHLAGLIKRHCFEINSVVIYNNASEAFDHLKTHHYDVAFLDVKMPELNGFQLLEKAQLAGETEVVFTTAHSEFAVDAFGVNATHYILKPVDETDLVKAVRKVSKNLSQKSAEQPLAESSTEKRISIYDGEDYLLIKESEVLRLEASGSYTKVFSTKQGEMLTSKRLGYYLEKLSPKSFFRCHHSHLINLAHVLKVSKGRSGHVTLCNGHLVPVSATRKAELHELLNL